MSSGRPPGKFRYPSRPVGISDSEIGHPTSGQRMRVVAHGVPIVVAGHQITEAVHGFGIRQQFGKEFAQRSNFGPRSDQSQLSAAVHDHPLGSGPTLGLIGVEQHRDRATGSDGGQLPAEVHCILQTQVQSRATERGVDMRGVADQDHPARFVP